MGTRDTAQRATRLYLTYSQKVFLLAALPLVLAASAIALVVMNQARSLAEAEIKLMEARLLEAKQSELVNYMSLARTAIGHIYGNAAPDDEEAKREVAQILAAMTYGDDGFFFVYDYDGENIVAPKQTYLIGRNWLDARDRNGGFVVRELIDRARSGGGYHLYPWAQPSTEQIGQMYSYVIGFQDWRWAVGTGIWIDDALADVASLRIDTEKRIRNTFFWIVVITVIALVSVFISGLLLNFHEKRLADAKLKELTQRIFDTQEEERSRVARELHDGISQILVGIRYTLELAARRLRSGTGDEGNTLGKAAQGLNTAIQEVRRISRDLRPGVLDDLGLGPALKTLVEEFSARTGISTEFKTVVFRNRLADDAKTALFRVAQEALTNIERHANASHVIISLAGSRTGATLRIIDNGVGMSTRKAGESRGLGLRNMSERIEQLNGTLRILSTSRGTTVEARLPLRHMLSADETNPENRKTA